ncbi:MAG: hypothetical protein F2942_01800 [Actinobacteria bacterium]|uniref:Unannotated protein n=1 Tax=freshwater metagenome TaxID=449393 RepID=A0A6J7UEG0_9ZZZZ|nr:hypothetical protein [Actinomycetota bacterium]
MSEQQPSGPFIISHSSVDGPIVRLHYGFGSTQEFTEVIEFDRDLPQEGQVGFEDFSRAVRVLLLIAGVSYYKSIAPTQIEAPALNAAESALLLAMYDEGLREFAYRNNLPVPLPVDLVERPGIAPELTVDSPTVRDGSLIPVGGGKDSALVADLVPDGVLMAVNPKGAHQHLAEHLGRPLLSVQRTLDPQLRELVAAGALNGHVPVTAINSAIAVALAVLIDRRDVLMGLERSASEPSLVIPAEAGRPEIEVNHQYSKSAEAEQLLRAVFDPIGVRYLSLLRPMTELAIGRSVAQRGLASDIVSCNRAFTLWNENESSRTQRPCGDCAKCLFTALMLAPSLSPDQVREQFGRDLLDESDHLDPVRELWSAEKPFDCVGERHESAAAVALLAELPEWKSQLIPKQLQAEAAQVLAEVGALPAQFLQIDSVEDLPPEYQQMIANLER